MLTLVRNLILIIGWPVLIGGSLYLFFKGRQVYRLVKGSLIGKITKALVFTMLVEMYSLGIVCTAYMFSDVRSTYLVFPVFLAWFLVFVWSLKILFEAEAETRKLAAG